MRLLAAEIAHRKQVEVTLRATLRTLRVSEAAERERAVRVQGLVDGLRDELQVNELFMGVLAHDLRAPLAAIVTAAQLMRSREAVATDSRNAKAIAACCPAASGWRG